MMSWIRGGGARDGGRCRAVGLAALALAAGVSAEPVEEGGRDRQTLVLVEGAEGEPQYGRMFAAWADRWAEAGGRGEADIVRIGRGTAEKPDRELLAAALAAATNSADTLWLVLIGHGTFDGRSAKFNLRGPDVSAEELAGWLQPLQRPQVVINCASSSSPFLNALAGPRRVVVTATRSGHERNFARFGDYLSSAIANPQADLDKDGQTSLLEAYLLASDQLAAFYTEQSRLATEHPLLDDNADGLGTPADWFRGTRAVKVAREGATPDGVRANQIGLIRSAEERRLSPAVRQKRDALEFRLAALRASKPSFDESVYYQQLEEILQQLAGLYAEATAANPPGDQGSP